MVDCDACRKPFDTLDRRPKSLPCAHTFCLTCVRHHRTKTCPHCRKRFKDSADLLPDNQKLMQAQQIILNLPPLDSKAIAEGVASPDSKVPVATQTFSLPLIQTSTQTSPGAEVAQSSTQTTPEPAEDKKDIKQCFPRFWCLDCEDEAGDDCLETHRLCNVRLLWAKRLEQAQSHLDTLSQNEDALAKMRSLIELASRSFEEELVDIRFLLDKEVTDLQERRSLLEEAAQSGDAAAWEEVKSSFTVNPVAGLPHVASQLMSDFSSEKSNFKLAMGSDSNAEDDVQWIATVPASEDPFAKLLMCRLLCKGGLKQAPSLDKVQSEKDLEAQKCEKNKETEIEEEEEYEGGLQWEERSNTLDHLSAEEMAARLRIGSVVGRGRDWQGTDSSMRSGKVKNIEAGKVTVQWSCGVRGTYNMGAEGQYCLKLFANHLENGWGVLSRGTPESLNCDKLSGSNDIKEKTSLLTSGRLKNVRALLSLRCTSPGWSRQVLQQAAADLEDLVLVNPEQQHLDVVQDMPRLRKLVLMGAGKLVAPLPPGLEELYLQTVNRDQLLVVAKLPALRRLEVGCHFSDPVPEVPFPRALPPAGLRWLRCGLYPLRTALRLMRAHRTTLEVVELVAASREPYGCPDLATELGRCRLRRLKRLIFLRETGKKFCKHDALDCSKQKFQVWDVLMTLGILTVVECSLCD